MRYFIYFLLLFSTTLLEAIPIDEHSSNFSILENASFLLVKHNRLNQVQILDQNFTSNRLKMLNLGYRADVDLWIKFELNNKGQKDLEKTLEFSHDETEKIFFYDGNKTFHDGLSCRNRKNFQLYPSFPIFLKKNESRSYYLQVHSKIKPLVVKLTLWNKSEFVAYDLRHQSYLFVFLGILLTLFIYNFILFFITKDTIYFYYVFYLFGVMIFHSFFSGILFVYFLSSDIAPFAVKANIAFGMPLMISAILFAQNFLHTKQFPKLHKGLNFSMVAVLIISLLSYNNVYLDSNSINLFLLIGLFVIYIGFYALFKGVPEAKYYVVGWSIILISIGILGFQAIFKYDIKEYHLTYVVEIAFILEALLFSLALANKINVANREKALSDSKLIMFQIQEQERLQALVEERTEDLKNSLGQKDILYKELNHRVKNNFMMILSLLKLQISRTKFMETKESLTVTKNRIESIANLYEMLLLSNEDIDIDTESYLERIYSNIAVNFQDNIKIIYKIEHDLELDSLIYVGLVFNELITNSFKYAFDKLGGEIVISLYTKENRIYFSVKDNGKGFQTRRKNSLGLTIVEILVEGQLQGVLDIDSSLGTTILMSWLEKKV